MPVNLSSEAKAKWAEAQGAREPAVKARLLREFYSLMRKHKGTERLEMAIKRQIAALEEEVARAQTRGTGSSRLEWVVRKEGMIQLAVVGSLAASLPFFRLLTGLDVSPYEVMLRPVVGSFRGAGVQFQVVLTPVDPSIGEEKQERLMALARNVDGLLLVVGFEGSNYVQNVLARFEEHGLDLLSQQLAAEVMRTPTGGVRVVGRSVRIDERELVEFLRGYNVKNAVVKISREATLDDVESALFGRGLKKTLSIALNQAVPKPMEGVVQNFVVFDRDLDALAEQVLGRLGLIRVFTKGVGEEPVDRPLLMEAGATVLDVAEEIHKDLAKYFRYARVWRGTSMAGVKVGRMFPLRDGDLVEIRTG